MGFGNGERFGTQQPVAVADHTHGHGLRRTGRGTCCAKWRSHRARSRTAGSATVSVLAIIATAAAVLALVIALIKITQQRTQLQGVADLAAVAGATEWNYALSDDPCHRARTVAGRNSAQMSDCAVFGSSVQVVITPIRGGPFNISAVARAGPADH